MRHNENENATCENCPYWQEGADALRPALGFCRRRSPTLDGWPSSAASEWCGEHPRFSTSELAEE